MNSGQYITLFIPVMLGAFVVWELVQLYRKRGGNASALTMSQYVTRKAKAGSWFFRVFILAFPIFLLVLSVWLVLHWEGLCINFNWMCSIGEQL